MLLKNTNSGMGSRRIFKPVEGEIEALQLLEGFYLSSAVRSGISRSLSTVLSF
jgi:hypothetical protein